MSVFAKIKGFIDGVKNVFGKIRTWFKENKVIDAIKRKMKEGYAWMGTDGIINAETSALLFLVLILFFPLVWAIVASVVIVLGKCAMDKKRGSTKEKHDLICCLIGVAFGVILAIGHAAVIAF